MKVAFTPRARRRAVAVETWWREYRPSAPDLFTRELAAAVETLANQPHIGPVYATIAATVMRRLLLPGTEQHVYYEVDAAAGIVIVHTIWGARQRRGPRL